MLHFRKSSDLCGGYHQTLGTSYRQEGGADMSDTIEARQQKEKEQLLEQLRKMPIVQIACEKLGIARSTYYRWRKEDPVFSNQADSAIDYGIKFMNDMAESQLLSSIRDKNMTGII